jgi:hypothetical protein
MAKDDDPRAPYKVYEGDELKGTYAARQGTAAATTTREPASNRLRTATLLHHQG